jgi:hypothetical protein
MATREYRLSEFSSEGLPPPEQPLQVLCEDHCGTYVLPYPCRWSEGAWWNIKSGQQIEGTVIGWRVRGR